MTFRDYLLEGFKTSSMKKVDVDVLSETAREDLVNILLDEVKLLKGDYYDDVYQDLFGLVDPPKIKIGYGDPVSLRKGFGKHRKTSALQVEKLYTKINSGIELDPVSVSKNKFIDGGHRVEAYLKAGKKKMPVMDINSLLTMDWEKWREGEDIEF